MRSALAPPIPSPAAYPVRRKKFLGRVKLTSDLRAKISGERPARRDTVQRWLPWRRNSPGLDVRLLLGSGNCRSQESGVTYLCPLSLSAG